MYRCSIDAFISLHSPLEILTVSKAEPCQVCTHSMSNLRQEVEVRLSQRYTAGETDLDKDKEDRVGN